MFEGEHAVYMIHIFWLQTALATNLLLQPSALRGELLSQAQVPDLTTPQYKPILVPCGTG